MPAVNAVEPVRRLEDYVALERKVLELERKVDFLQRKLNESERQTERHRSQAERHRIEAERQRNDDKKIIEELTEKLTNTRWTLKKKNAWLQRTFEDMETIKANQRATCRKSLARYQRHPRMLINVRPYCQNQSPHDDQRQFTQTPHSDDLYQYLGRMPASVDKQRPWSYILRLSTIMQLLEGEDLGKISDYRITAYTYAAVDEATGAIDGATGEIIDDFRSICVLHHRAWQVYCWCRKCLPRTSIINHLRHTAKAAPVYEDAPLIRTGIGRETCIRTIEQIWLLMPKYEVCPERQLLWDQLNASPSSTAARSPSWQEIGSDDVDEGHQ